MNQTSASTVSSWDGISEYLQLLTLHSDPMKPGGKIGGWLNFFRSMIPRGRRSRPLT